jgi:hypothetical protein
MKMGQGCLETLQMVLDETKKNLGNFKSRDSRAVPNIRSAPREFLNELTRNLNFRDPWVVHKRKNWEVSIEQNQQNQNLQAI